MLRSRSHNSICEQEAKLVQERIAAVEKYFAELCTVFAAFTRKAARLRDKNDEVAKVIQTYAESETINRSLSRGLINFATTLSVIGDYKDAETQRLDSKVIAPLSQYSLICKHAREDVKNIFNARDKQLAKKRHLDKIRERNPRNRQMISQAESDLMKATVEVTRVVKGLEEQIDSFEKRKLHDIKTILIDFTKIELAFHTKAVELLTKAYQDIAEIDETKDLEDYQLARGEFNAEFREVLNFPEAISRLDTVRRTSFRQSCSLSNLANRISSSPLLNIRKLTNKKSNSKNSMKMSELKNSSESVQVEEYDNEDDDEDDGDEDIDEDDDDDNDGSSDGTEISTSIKESPINKSGMKNSFKYGGKFILRPVPPITHYRQAHTYPVNRRMPHN